MGSEHPSPVGPASLGAPLTPPGSFHHFFTSARATGVQSGPGAAPGCAPGRATVLYCGARRSGTGRGGAAGAPCPRCGASLRSAVLLPAARQLVLGTSHFGVPLRVLFFFFFSPERPKVPLLRGPRWVKRMLGVAAGPAALPDPDLHGTGVPMVGEASGADPLQLQRV